MNKTIFFIGLLIFLINLGNTIWKVENSIWLTGMLTGIALMILSRGKK